MNTIPLTFNERQIKRTVLGGTSAPKTAEKLPLSVILLSRSGSAFRVNNLDKLLPMGFKQIVSVESPAVNYNLDELAKRYPSVKFIVPQEEVTPGDMINLGMSEITGEEVLVIWDTVNVNPRFLTKKLAERFADDSILCQVPLLASEKMDVLPVRMIPSVEKGSLAVTGIHQAPEGSATIYPFDYIGVYNRKKFIMLGGFDYTITSSYWQNLDFAVRAWLWGEEFRMVPQFRLNYETGILAEDTTPDKSQLRFYLKNMAPKFVQDYAYIPKIRFFSYLRRSSCSLSEALKDFKNARLWVEKNKYRYKKDAIELIDFWEKESV